jgi:hypothetical protein
MSEVTVQMLTLPSLNVNVFWYVGPCSLVEIDRSFKDVYCLHHQGDEADSTFEGSVRDYTGRHSRRQPRLYYTTGVPSRFYATHISDLAIYGDLSVDCHMKFRHFVLSIK